MTSYNNRLTSLPVLSSGFGVTYKLLDNQLLEILLSSGLLISLGIDFIPLMITIIYVGAITILFLFVITMLDIIQYSGITSITHIIF